jgi:RNA polymerase sigma-70 factor, ECF subfamily
MDNWQDIKRGDIKVFSKVFRYYYPLLCNYANIFCKNHSISEEVVQEVFINLWENRKSITIKTSLEKYLYISVKNRSYNYFRDNFKLILSEIDGIEIPYNPNGYLEFNELKKICEKAIDELPLKCKEIFMLSREEGLSYRQIADMKGISYKTVENQLGIALKKLRNQLGPYIDIIFCLLIASIT